MASFVVEEFVGTGVLRDVQLILDPACSWTVDVPTLKMMSKSNHHMDDALHLTHLQRDALELRTYLHDRNLMAYADTLEACGRNLSELLVTSPTELTTEYKMRRGHVARFLDRGRSACGVVQMPPRNLLHLHPPHTQFTSTHTHTHRKKKAATAAASDQSSMAPATPNPRLEQMKYGHVVSNSTTNTDMSPHNPSVSFMTRMNYNAGSGLGPSLTSDSEYKGSSLLLRPTSTGQALAADQEMSKGIFAAPVAETRCCGLVRLSALKEEVTALAVLEKIVVQQLAPAYGSGENPFICSKALGALAAPVKASELWAEQPTLVLCLRRSGCVMCRAEAHQLYSRKPIFDAMGIQMVVCLNEHIDAEVRSFWPRYWGGMVVVDKQRGFFQALGQGKLPKEGFVAGFLFNSLARANYKRAMATSIEGNYAGKGTIKGGLYIVRRGCGGVAYQFVERNFGDWAPLSQVLQVCSHIMQIVCCVSLQNFNLRDKLRNSVVNNGVLGVPSGSNSSVLDTVQE